MISIKRKTFALVILSVLALLVAQGCQNSSTGVPTDVSIDTSPDTTNLVPNIVGETFEHGEFNLRDSVGRPTVINFWHHGCDSCAQTVSDVQNAYEQYGDQVDFIGVFLNYNNEPEARSFLDDAGITYPNLRNSTIQPEYGVDVIPVHIRRERGPDRLSRN